MKSKIIVKCSIEILFFCVREILFPLNPLEILFFCRRIHSFCRLRWSIEARISLIRSFISWRILRSIAIFSYYIVRNTVRQPNIWSDSIQIGLFGLFGPIQPTICTHICLPPTILVPTMLLSQPNGRQSRIVVPQMEVVRPPSEANKRSL